MKNIHKTIIISICLSIVCFCFYINFFLPQKEISAKKPFKPIDETTIHEQFPLENVKNSIFYIKTSKTSGSGFIFNIGGMNTYIVTSKSLIENQDNIQVFIGNDKITPTVVGFDSKYNIALLKIPNQDNHKELKKIETSNEYTLGEKVYATGITQDSEIYFSSGVISLIQDKKSVPFILTDTFISEGNFGGALVNQKGQMIAMIPNSNNRLPSMFLYTKDVEDTILSIADSKEDDTPYYLGIEGSTVTSEMSYSLKMPKGVYITKVDSGSPASLVQCKTGDIIISFNKHTISNYENLKEIISRCNDKESYTLKVMRINANGNYTEKEMKIKLRKIEEKQESGGQWK